MQLQQAELMNFLRTLLIIFFIYYLFKFLARLFAPYLMKKAVEKMQQKAEQHFGNQQQKTDVKEGETVIDKAPKSIGENNKDVGEYVDFEEID